MSDGWLWRLNKKGKFTTKSFFFGLENINSSSSSQGHLGFEFPFNGQLLYVEHLSR